MTQQPKQCKYNNPNECHLVAMVAPCAITSKEMCIDYAPADQLGSLSSGRREKVQANVINSVMVKKSDCRLSGSHLETQSIAGEENKDSVSLSNADNQPAVSQSLPEPSTFEKMFPSLAQYSIFYELDAIDEIKKHIINHCLDAEKVKEIIKKSKRCGVKENILDGDYLLKELGLTEK